MTRKILLAVGAVVAIVAVLGFYLGARQSSADQAMRLPVDPAPLVAETAAGDRSFTIEIADDQSERSAGLMFRESLAPEAGMLFVYPGEQEIRMWMKNTLIPLDMLFVASDGRIVSIAENTVPLSEEVISSGAAVQGVIELAAGTAQRLGIEPGDRVRHPVFGGG